MLTETELVWIRFHFGKDFPADVRQAALAGQMPIKQMVEVMAKAWRDSEDANESVRTSMGIILANIDEAAKYAAGCLGLT